MEYLDLCLALSSMMRMLSKYVRSVVYRACSGESLLSSTIDCTVRGLQSLEKVSGLSWML